MQPDKSVKSSSGWHQNNNSPLSDITATLSRSLHSDTCHSIHNSRCPSNNTFGVLLHSSPFSITCITPMCLVHLITLLHSHYFSPAFQASRLKHIQPSLSGSNFSRVCPISHSWNNNSHRHASHCFPTKSSAPHHMNYALYSLSSSPTFFRPYL